MEVFLYGIWMRIASWFSPKVLRWLQSRKGWRERLVEAREADKPLIWVHIPSMEVQSQYSLLLQNLQQPYSRAQLLISYQEVPEDWDEEDEHHFLPLDTRGNAEDWLDILMPSMAVMVFPELPEHMLKECKERAIPSYVIGTRLEKGDALLSLVGRGQLRRKLALTSHVFIEDQDTAKHLFSKIKLEESHGTVVGDTEVDELVALVGQAPEVPRLSNFTEGSLTVLVYQAGGMEERMVERLAQNPVFARVKWVIIPRKMDYDRLDKRTEDKSDTELLFSDKTAIREGHRIMWIDEPIGDSFVPYFQYASVAVVGGGFVPLRLPPVWIPAVYGLPIYFGPEYKHRISARELHAQGGAQVFRSRGKLTKLLREHVRQPISEMAKKDIRTYVSNNTGASQKLITELLNRHPNL